MKTEYNVIMPEGATSPPNVTAEPNFAGATMTITQASSIPGRAIIEVTAEDGITKRTADRFIIYIIKTIAATAR